jgi:hypothetical protein
VALICSSARVQSSTEATPVRVQRPSKAVTRPLPPLLRPSTTCAEGRRATRAEHPLGNPPTSASSTCCGRSAHSVQPGHAQPRGLPRLYGGDQPRARRFCRASPTPPNGGPEGENVPAKRETEDASAPGLSNQDAPTPPTLCVRWSRRSPRTTSIDAIRPGAKMLTQPVPAGRHHAGCKRASRCDSSTRPDRDLVHRGGSAGRVRFALGGTDLGAILVAGAALPLAIHGAGSTPGGSPFLAVGIARKTPEPTYQRQPVPAPNPQRYPRSAAHIAR